MKEVLSLATFALGVLCFLAFVTTVKPRAISAIRRRPTTAERTSVCGDARQPSQQCQAPSGSPWQLGAAEFYGRDTTTARSRGTCPDDSRVKLIATSGRTRVGRDGPTRAYGIFPELLAWPVGRS